MLKLVSNQNAVHRTRALGARARRLFSVMQRRFLSAFFMAFPMPDAPDPQPTPPIAKAAVLREGAVLSEMTDAVATKKIA
jgi:hypothetical protein